MNLGVTSGGDFFGGTQISFTDVLGDQQFSMFAASVSQYRTMSFSYLNLERRFQWAVQGYSQTQFFYGAARRTSSTTRRSAASSTATSPWRRGRCAAARRSASIRSTATAASSSTAASSTTRERFDDPALEDIRRTYQEQQFGRQLFNNGTMVPLGVAFMQETTVFREFGPLAGSTMRLGYEVAPKIGDSTLSRQTIDVDARKYLPARRQRPAGRCARAASSSWGDNPGFLYFGGNSEMRGYDYLSFVGQDAFFLNAELRFPLIEAMATPIGILGGIRGTFFANIGGADWANQPFKASGATTPTIERPIVGYNVQDPITVDVTAGLRRSRARSTGFRLVDARASYGISLQTFALGFPVHFDWAGERSSTRTGRTSSSRSRAAAPRSASRSSRCGSGTTSKARRARRRHEDHED